MTRLEQVSPPPRDHREVHPALDEACGREAGASRDPLHNTAHCYVVEGIDGWVVEANSRNGKSRAAESTHNGRRDFKSI